MPGEALLVPVKAPHFVQNGPAVSISFSITWRSERSVAEGELHSLNARRSEEHTSELQSLMLNSYAVFCLKNTFYLTMPLSIFYYFIHYLSHTLKIHFSYY